MCEIAVILCLHTFFHPFQLSLLSLLTQDFMQLLRVRTNEPHINFRPHRPLTKHSAFSTFPHLCIPPCDTSLPNCIPLISDDKNKTQECRPCWRPTLFRPRFDNAIVKYLHTSFRYRGSCGKSTCRALFLSVSGVGVAPDGASVSFWGAYEVQMAILDAWQKQFRRSEL